jgi:hypothetical protein
VNAPQWLLCNKLEILVRTPNLITGHAEILVLALEAEMNVWPVENREPSGEHQIRQVMTLMPGSAATQSEVHRDFIAQPGRQAHVRGNKGLGQKIDPILLDVGTIWGRESIYALRPEIDEITAASYLKRRPPG